MSQTNSYELPDEMGMSPDDGDEYLYELTSKLDQNRRLLHATVTRYYQIPINSNGKKMHIAANELGTKLHDAFEFIIKNNNYSDTEKVSMIMTFMQQDDAERCSLLNELTGSTDYEPVNIEGFSELLLDKLVAQRLGFTESQNYMDQDELVTMLMSICSTSFNTDFEAFMAHVKKTKNARFLQSAKTVGHYTKDIGKIAAGVAIGTVIANRFNK